MSTSFSANGKLLLTAEYFVLDGAKALALPVNRGQELHIQAANTSNNQLHWQSYNADGNCWFEGYFNLPELSYQKGTDEKVGKKLENIFQYIRKQRPNFLAQKKDVNVHTTLGFPPAWGLGTSSTLIANMAAWASVNPFDLQFAAFGGSGYDIACANVQHPILYQKTPAIRVQKVDFSPTFQDRLYFIYLGKKQNSRSGIAHYRERLRAAPHLIDEVTQLTQACLETQNLQTFEQVIAAHEHLIAKNVQLQRAKMLYFSDFWGEVKSLGAWGGDFVLVTSNRTLEVTRSYFQARGFEHFFRYQDFTNFN